MSRRWSERLGARVFGSKVDLASEFRNPDVRVLVGSMVLFAILAIYRFYSYWTTGFFVSDEYGYFYDAIHSSFYSDRWFVGWMNIAIFKVFGITNVDSFSYLLPVYIFFFASLTLFVLFKLLKLMEFDRRTIALSLLSCLILISFVLLSLGFLTEPVGLSMTMVGIFFLTKFLKSTSAKGLVIFSFLSACFFGFAAGTREPYNAFLIAGSLAVVAIVVVRRKEIPRTKHFAKAIVIAIAVAAFLLPSFYFLFVPTQAYTEQVAPISGDLIQSVASNPLTYGSGSGAPSTTTVTSTVVVNNTTTTTTIIHTTPAPQIPFYRQFLLANTVLVFIGGIFLGWGPICFIIGLLGFAITLRRGIWHKDRLSGFVLLISVTALGSYFVVSFINAVDPYYFSFQNFSTIIRFSDTALPAFFVLCPFVMMAVAKRRRYLLGLGLSVLIFLVAFVPLYQTYAASNLAISTGDPFSLSYRSPAAAVRDYVNANVTGGAQVVNFPLGWAFTPGFEDLRSSTFYNGISQTDFEQDQWQTFYVYSGTDHTSISTQQAFLVPIIFQGLGEPANYTLPLPYHVVSDEVVLQGDGWVFIKVTMSWSSE